MLYENSNKNLVNSEVIIEKKKRGRKKTIKTDVVLTNLSSDSTTTTVTEKKIRKRRSKKNMALANGVTDTNGGTNGIESIESIDSKEVVPGVKVRKRRVCKSKNNKNGDINTDTNTDTNVIIDSTNPETHPPEEKVVKKRGRKPKGGKIITQKLEENNNNNEIPNIILHLKCSLNDIKNNDNNNQNCHELEQSQIQSYNNSTQLKGCDIFIKTSHSNTESKNSSSTAPHIPAYNDSLSHLFKVYNPVVISTDSENNETNTRVNTHTNNSNEILNHRTGLFNSIYSPDINLYNNDCNYNYDDGDDGDSLTDGTCKNEKEIWRKINQLKISFHKSDICKSTGGTQRSACFWCTCEFDSPAIYIPKTLTKDVYNVYGCFCSPECSAAFLMNENIDTSTKFERYHLLNLLYGKIYKYEKSIKIAPNPFYLLNKFYGNLTIQEYRKLFQSEQMIYVVNKPLTHILPELYEDNNDFLLNNKIIPTNSVNIKKNKPLKSNIINNAFGITAGGS
jgi:hypothetical protein